MFGQTKLSKWVDKHGNSIKLSAHHTDMYIIEYASGGFCTITTSQEIMLQMHPMK